MVDLPEDPTELLEALIAVYGRDLVLESIPSEEPGPPKGTGRDDRAGVYRMAKILHSAPGTSHRQAAFQSIHLVEAGSPDSRVDRLVEKFKLEEARWTRAVNALVELTEGVERIGQKVESMEVSSPLSAADKEKLQILVSHRDELHETAATVAENGPEEMAMDMWLVAHALDDKWAMFFSKRGFVQGRTQADEPPKIR